MGKRKKVVGRNGNRVSGMVKPKLPKVFFGVPSRCGVIQECLEELSPQLGLSLSPEYLYQVSERFVHVPLSPL